MKISETSRDFVQEVYAAVDSIILHPVGSLDISQIVVPLNITIDKVGDHTIVDGVIYIISSIERPNSIYLDQKYAGMILDKFKPKTNIEPNIILEKTISNWNKSVKEFPFWLKHNYGLERISNILSDFENHELNEVQADNIKTMKWWLKIKKNKASR